jgi:hypothetical protein
MRELPKENGNIYGFIITERKLCKKKEPLWSDSFLMQKTHYLYSSIFSRLLINSFVNLSIFS